MKDKIYKDYTLKELLSILVSLQEEYKCLKEVDICVLRMTSFNLDDEKAQLK